MNGDGGNINGEGWVGFEEEYAVRNSKVMTIRIRVCLVLNVYV